MGRAPLTFRRLSGLDRSGPPPPETQAGAPLRPWTIPNLIGYIRLALIPVFLVVELSSDTGTEPLGAVLFAVIGWSDYADGIAARVTGQYSRMGALLDPIVDRLLVVSGVIVCWKFDLLPRWLLAVMVAREVFMLVAGQYAIRHGVTLRINWYGRWGVWPVMSALFSALCGLKTLGTVLLVIGLVLTVMATVVYARDALDELRTRSPSS